MPTKSEAQQGDHDDAVDQRIGNHPGTEQPSTGATATAAMRQPPYREVASQTGQAQTDDRRKDGLQPRVHQSGQHVHDAMRLLPKPESRGDCKPADQQIEQAAGGEPQSRNDSKCRPVNTWKPSAIFYHVETNLSVGH
jgi:hypothetical protein